MKNTIVMTIPFSFKGKEHTPSTKIDLDAFCQQSQNIDALFHIVATENNIGNYSYEYEVLHASEAQFSDATGMAKNYLLNGNFDLEGYKESLNRVKTLSALQNIVKEVMNIDNLEEHQTLQLALERAFEAGRESASSSRQEPVFL